MSSARSVGKASNLTHHDLDSPFVQGCPINVEYQHTPVSKANSYSVSMSMLAIHFEIGRQPEQTKLPVAQPHVSDAEFSVGGNLHSVVD